MRFYVQEIKAHCNYVFTIGSRQKPDSRLKQWVKDTIGTAMGSFERDPGATHDVAVVQTATQETGNDDMGELVPGRQYMIFALLYSEEGLYDSRTEQEMAAEQAEIARAYETVLTPYHRQVGTRIAVVALNDCSVAAREIPGESSMAVFLV